MKTNDLPSVLPPSSPPPDVQRPLLASQLRLLAFATIALVICFAKPLYDLVVFALHSDLFSHVLLMPFVSLYLVWLKKASLPPDSEPARKAAVFPVVAALALLLGYFFALHSGLKLARADSLAWTILCFYLLFLGICLFCIGKEVVRANAFALGILLFIVPFPTILSGGIEAFLQYSSAMASHLLFTVTGMPVFRDGLSFQLPGMHIQVAPECSGIHSTLVLFITSLVAGQLFLQRPWKRWALALAVVPLGILRNAVRICTISYLCVHISPEMIDAPIHRRGGPLFFAVSLIPLFLLLSYLRRSESPRKAQSHPN